jgi:hypothetical protein
LWAVDSLDIKKSIINIPKKSIDLNIPGLDVDKNKVKLLLSIKKSNSKIDN